MSQRLLICTDLDRTLVPNGPEVESPGARARFAALVARPEVTLAYVSGRHLALVEDAMTEYGLPRPDYVIGDVGTTIYRQGEAGEWQHVRDWDARIGADWGGRRHTELRQSLAGLAGLEEQERSRQNRFKLSYLVPAKADTAALEADIRERLGSGVRARLVWSDDPLAGVGLLDILPAGASKYHAIRALMEQAGFAPDATVFCGDSGNDLEVLTSPLPAVLVANAAPAVRERAIAGAAAQGHEDALYCARGGFLGMNGHYAGGMLEGIAHYHPHSVAWMAACPEGVA